MDNRVQKTLSLFLVLALALALVFAGESQATGPTKEERALAGLKSTAQLNSFVANLRKALESNNRAAVSKMIDYPIEIQGQKPFTINNGAEFLKKYDAIMTKAVRKAALEEPFINRRGVILLSGSDAEIWLLGNDGKVRIITIFIN